MAFQSVFLVEEQLNISLKVINPSILKSINENKLINEIRNIKTTVTIEENDIYCRLGNIMARILSEMYPIPMKIVGVNDSFEQSRKREFLLNI